MITKIRKSPSKPKKSIKRIPASKKINLDKYFGKVPFGVDGLTYQKQIRGND